MPPHEERSVADSDDAGDRLQDPSTSQLLVFANARSGGGAAKTIVDIFSSVLGPENVFDLSQHNPRDVLQRRLAQIPQTQQGSGASTPRILVAGGDGTVTWVLGTLADLQLKKPASTPPVAIMPLGTGNDLAINLGWGKRFKKSWISNDARVHKTLETLLTATTTQLDYWNVTFSNLDTTSSTLPHAVSVQGPTSATSKFWNYFSIGLDAETAYNFHTLRETHPSCTNSRLINQAWYGIFTCGTGWFCGGRPLDRCVHRVRIKHTVEGEWNDVVVPPTIRAVVLLNLQTYGGGRDIWGMKNEANLERKGMRVPRKDDGLIEVIGFKNGWHTAVVMGEVSTRKVHGKRLGQGCAVELVLGPADGHHGSQQQRAKQRDHLDVCMQLDGEPWKHTLKETQTQAQTQAHTHTQAQTHGREPREGTGMMKILVEHGGSSTMLMKSYD